MNGVVIPIGHRLERLAKSHPRKAFSSGQLQVDDWLQTKALQNQDKRLSTTNVLLDANGGIAGFYTLATGQVDFADLPPDEVKKLPRRLLPVAVLAWLGVAVDRQSQKLGRLLLAQALRDCHTAGQTFAFIAVVLDCIDERAKSFYSQFDFAELPGSRNRLYLSSTRLDALARGDLS